MKPDKKIAIYTRKSKSTDKGESIEAQREACLNKAKEKFPEVDENSILFFTDEGFSGGNTKRPQFQQMIKLCEKKEIGVIISYKIDRLSRSINDFVRIMDDLKNYYVNFIASNENIDTTDPSQHFMMYLLSLFADFERKTIAQRIKDNMHHLAKSGRWLGGTTPIGYKSVEIKGGISESGKQRKAFRLDIVPEQADMVRTLFRKYLELGSLTGVDNYCLENGIKTRQGKTYSRNTLKPIFTNPVYAAADSDTLAYLRSLGAEIYADEAQFDGKHGLIAYNKTDQSKPGAHKVNDISDWIISVGKHRGLISGADWVKVQKLLSQNTQKGYHKPRSHTALLSGLVICGCCGGHMYPKLRTERKKENGEVPFNYYCDIKRRSKKAACDIRNINGVLLDKTALEQLSQMMRSDSDFIKTVGNARRTLEIENSEEKAALERLRAQKAELEKEINNLVRSLGTGDDDYSAKIIRDTINQKGAEIGRTDELIGEKERELRVKTVSMEQFDELIGQVRSLSGEIDSLTFEKKRELIKSAVKRVIWDGETSYIVFAGSEYDVPFEGEEIRSIVEKLRKDSERNTHAPPFGEKAGG